MESSFKNTQNTPYPGTQAVLRAIALLKAFTDTQPDLSLSELAQAAHLKKPTAFRLLTALESAGMVVRSPNSDAYRLGPQIIVLGGKALRSNDLRSASHSELKRLARKTGETATLEILLDGEVLILDEVLGSHLVGTTPSIGTRWPAQLTSTGKVLLAHLPPQELAAILGQLKGLPPSESSSPRGLEGELEPIAQYGHNLRELEGELGRIAQHDLNLRELEGELKRIAIQGYATAVEELETGFVAAGAPVHDHTGRAAAAISVGGPSARLTSQRLAEIIPLVKESAARISARLGFEE